MILFFQNVYGNPAIPFLVQRLGSTELIFPRYFCNAFAMNSDGNFSFLLLY
jgi:hypothetical protein